mmetsp:Transcript_96607/g.118363  ORF Transcript_96607/g.118363 Transcript_96607/m.118363 type:complete len:286 (-) Transcript_96607:851-1708(-)
MVQSGLIIIVCCLIATIVYAGVVFPNCKFAEESSFSIALHYFPIDACVVESYNITTNELIAYKYECPTDTTLNKVYYNTTDCSDAPFMVKDVTNSNNTVAFNCDSSALNCSYSNINQYSKCGFDINEPDNTTCDDCAANPENFNLRRIPWITGQCYGVDGVYRYHTCTGNVTFTDYIGFVPTCNFDENTWFPLETLYNNECSFNEYLEIDCVTGSPTLEPSQAPSISPTIMTVTPSISPSIMTTSPSTSPTMEPTISTDTDSAFTLNLNIYVYISIFFIVYIISL